MKTIQFLIVALVLGNLSMQKMYSQAEFGVKGGLNFSNLYTEDVDDQNMLAGFNLGLFTEIPVSDMVSVQPEINFTTKGAQLVYNNALVQGTAKFRLNYVEIPLLLKINVADAFNVHVGPYAALLVDSKITNETENGTFDFENTINPDDLNKFDAGLAAGIGFDTSSFGLGLRYNYGLVTVGKERTFLGQTYTFPNSKNSALSLYATVKF